MPARRAASFSAGRPGHPGSGSGPGQRRPHGAGGSRWRRRGWSARRSPPPAWGHHRAAWRRRPRPVVRTGWRWSAQACGSASAASVPTHRSCPVVNASCRASRNHRRNRRDRTRTGRKHPGRQATRWVPSGESPPPGMTQWRWGVHERLSPRMEHREDADLRAQMPGIGGDGPKEEAVDHRRVLGRNLRDRPGQGEDDVDVLNVEQVRLARLDPRRARERLALVAVPMTAGVIPDAPVAASAGPPRHTSSESCGAGGGDAVETLHHVLGAEHHRQSLRLLRGRDHGLDPPRLLERDPVETPEG